MMYKSYDCYGGGWYFCFMFIKNRIHKKQLSNDQIRSIMFCASLE